MLREDMLLQMFNEETSGKNHAEGQRVLSNDLVSSLDIITEEELISLDGNVISESLFNEYRTRIKIDGKNKDILSTSCSCSDYEKQGNKKRNYCCKHLVATFYKALEELAKHPNFNEDDEQISRNRGNILDLLLGDNKNKDEIKLEVLLNRDEWDHKLSAEFRIGLDFMSSGGLYILRDINQFLVALYNKVPVEYGKNFTFNIKNQRLSIGDKRIIDFIELLKSLEGNQKYVGRNAEKYIEGKFLNIPEYLVRQFLEIIRNHRVYLNEGFFNRPVDTEILITSPPVDFDLKLIKGDYVLKSPGGMPKALGSCNDAFLYGTIIYLPDYDFCYKIIPYLQVFNEAQVVTFPEAQEEAVLRSLIPDLNLLSPEVTLSKAITDKIVMDGCQCNFYFDMDDMDIILTVKVKYGLCEFNIFEEYTEKIIYRDSKKETQIISTLRALGFEKVKNQFHLMMGEDYIFRFFKSEIARLQELGEVYYSENFKSLKSMGPKSIMGEIKSGKYDYFEMNFKLGDIPSEEVTGILRAFRDNLKYFRLKTGEFLDLEELELKKFLKLLDSVSPENINGSCIEISKAKGAYIDSFIEENDLRYIKGKSELKEVRDRLKDIEKLAFKEPVDLQGSLREYQKIGYNWLKTLDYLGFGGILGDEMGLGKTLQTITFLLSAKGKKALIVAPTSLVYNWVSEFQKFAPSLKVAAINGSKPEREEAIRNIKDYDVLITTYNLVKRDLENYSAIDFDYCILDEAQNIKNPGSQNAAAVKEIKAGRKFALSGTPIENSLMELWSIFDFVMPGYLYDEKRFSVRYHKKLREEPVVIEELNRLIKPFILRRRKKDVIKELPDKIESTLTVDLEEEQKKVYKAYNNYAMELIKKKVKDYEFQNSKIEILSYITRLRQICLDPSVIMNDYGGSNSKLEALVELLHQSIEEGHRILVFSQFTSVLRNIGKRINAEGITYSYLDGSISAEKRMETVKGFNEGENPVFLISLKAGGTGLNLTSADIVIHYDPWWNPAVEDQATDRAHRIGQKNVVEVIKIIAKGTIEEKILALQEDKRKLISELMGDELTGSDGFASLSQEEILGLFS